MKERMDSFDIRAAVAELEALEGGWTGKVYQDGDRVIMRIKKDGVHELMVHSGRWLCLTEHRESSERHPPTFAMTLRKYVGNQRLRSIEQHGFDRVVVMRFGNGYSLVAELFSEGNVLLLDGHGDIVLPLHEQSWSQRELRPRRSYMFPPERCDPFSLQLSDFRDLFNRSSSDVVRTMVLDVNVPGKWSEELCRQADVDRHAPAAALDDGVVRRLYERLEALLDRFRERRFDPVILEGNGAADVLPVPLSVHRDGQLRRYETFNRALDVFYQRIREPEAEERESTGARDRLRRRITQQQNAIESFREQMTEARLRGNAIYANYQTCEALLAAARDDIDTYEGSELRSFSYPMVTAVLPFEDDEVEVTLDVRKNVPRNANAYYEREKKVREKIEGAREALEMSRRALERDEMAVEETPERTARQTFWFEAYRWCVSSQGNLVICGRDAASNEEVVKKHLESDDRYVHADLHGAPSCVVKAQGPDGEKRAIGEQTLEEACQLALSHSSAWKQYAGGRAYWVTPGQVSKTPESGEHLPTGAFVIRGKRHYVKCPVRLAVGAVEVMGARKVMVGPPGAVASHADRMLVIEPGATDKNQVARELAERFGADVETLQQQLPPGDLRVREEQ
ncbi:MAG: ribosome rescue protein RqcH [Thermoplasmatota archaeon]